MTELAFISLFFYKKTHYNFQTMNRTIKIPLAALPVISDLIIDNDLQHEIIASNNAKSVPSIGRMITISRTMPKARYCCRGLLFVANILNEITLQRYYKKYFARSIIIGSNHRPFWNIGAIAGDDNRMYDFGNCFSKTVWLLALSLRVCYIGWLFFIRLVARCIFNSS